MTERAQQTTEALRAFREACRLAVMSFPTQCTMHNARQGAALAMSVHIAVTAADYDLPGKQVYGLRPDMGLAIHHRQRHTRVSW